LAQDFSLRLKFLKGREHLSAVKRQPLFIRLKERGEHLT